MQTVLVTGLSGFTGKYIEKELIQQGYIVKGLPLECDITIKSRVKAELEKIKPDYIIHLAALSFVQHHDQNALYQVNVFGTLNILESVIELNIPINKIIIASSANIYGNPFHASLAIKETQAPQPINHYANSKLAMEFMVKTLFDKLPIIITRPFNYTGAGQAAHFLIPKIVDHFRRKQKTIELGNLDVSRDFSDVKDVSKSYVKLLKSSVHSEIFNICSMKMHSLENIILNMEEIAGYKIAVTVNPLFTRDNEIKRLSGDNSKLNEAIDYKPETPILSTLRDMFEYNESIN